MIKFEVETFTLQTSTSTGVHRAILAISFCCTCFEERKLLNMDKMLKSRVD